MRAGVALVGRDRRPAHRRRDEQGQRYLAKGGKGSVTLEHPGRFDRITAVVVNADDRVNGFARNDWVYSPRRSPFEAELSG